MQQKKTTIATEQQQRNSRFPQLRWLACHPCNQSCCPQSQKSLERLFSEFDILLDQRIAEPSFCHSQDKGRDNSWTPDRNWNSDPMSKLHPGSHKLENIKITLEAILGVPKYHTIPLYTKTTPHERHLRSHQVFNFINTKNVKLQAN